MEKMVKKLLVPCSVLFLLATAVSAFGGPAPQQQNSGGQARPAVSGGSFLVDDFESGSLQSPRQWWTFDMQKIAAESNDVLTAGDPAVVVKKGKYSMIMKGVCKNWYAGGAGVYFAKENQDLSVYNSLQIDVYGNGEGSGTLKVELFDDDNANWQVEQNPAKNYAAVNDDKFVYSQVVDWKGWQRLVIPFGDFVDDNPGVGDGVWNPQQSNGSGGLLQMQLICLGSTDKSPINLYLDNISLVESGH